MTIEVYKYTGSDSFNFTLPKGHIMAIRWRLLLISILVLHASETRAWEEYYFTEGEDATIPLFQALDQPLEAYVWSLQHAHKDHPFYIHNVHASHGTFYRPMLETSDQRGRMSVSYEMREGVLFVKFSILRVLKSDAATYLLTVAERGSQQSVSVLSFVLHVLPSHDDNIAEIEIDNHALKGQMRFCNPAYTAPQVTDWRYVRFSTFGGKSALFYCYKLYPSPGEFITGYMFHRKDLYGDSIMLDIGILFYCCMAFQNQVRCESYELDSNGNLTLIDVGGQEAFYTPFRKPSTHSPDGQ